MIYLDLHIIVSIGNKVIDTVSEILISNDKNRIGTTCVITVPLNSRIEMVEQTVIMPTLQAFKKGDEVTISAWYTGYDSIVVFEGYVLDFYEGTPLQIRCVDETFNLRFPKGGNVTYSSGKSVKKFSEIAKKILSGTGVTLASDAVDFDCQNITFSDASPEACIEYFRKELHLSMNLIKKTIYVNYARNVIETRKLKSDVNVYEANLQKPDTAFQNIQLNVWGLDEKGRRVKYQAGNAGGEVHEMNVSILSTKNKKGVDTNTHKKIIDSSLDNAKMGKFSGTFVSALYPVINLFDMIEYEDVRYPERSGNYIVQGTELKINAKDGVLRTSTVACIPS